MAGARANGAGVAKPARTSRPARNGPAEASGTAVPAAARAMALFEIFARERRELTKSEVARLLDLPESSTSDLLNTLHDLGYLSRTVSTRRYYPTGRLYVTAAQIAENDALTAFGSEATSLLAHRSGETSACAVLSEGSIKVVAVADGKHRLRYVINVGDVFTIHGTAIGKSLLGGLPDDEMHRVLRLKPLRPLTPNTTTEPSALEEEIRRQREMGWYRSVDEGTLGVSSFAVSGRVGDRVLGLGIIGPTARIGADSSRLRALVEDVRETVFGGRD